MKGVLLLLPLAALALARKGRRPNRTPPGGGYDEIWAWAQWVESTGALPGFSVFARAVAATESNGNNLIARGRRTHAIPSNVKVIADARAADAACRLYEGAKSRGFYRDNPYPEEAWCFGSGGWFGILPASGLAAGGPSGPFRNSDPALIFEPIPSIVMLADFAARVIGSSSFRNLPRSQQTWLAVRRGMASTELVGDHTEQSERSVGVRHRFAEALEKTGAGANFMNSLAEAGTYPGPEALLSTLNAASSGKGATT